MPFALPKLKEMIKQFDLTGRVAIITGSSKGIGESIARGLAEHGAKVAITSRKLENLEPMKKEIEDLGAECFAVASDVRDFEAVENAISEAFLQGGIVL